MLGTMVCRRQKRFWIAVVTFKSKVKVKSVCVARNINSFYNFNGGGLFFVQ